jgi:hypothetical protein
MTWNLAGQYLDLILACILIVRLIKLKFYSNYRPLIVFVTYEGLQALNYIGMRDVPALGEDGLDYRLVWSVERWIAWFTAIWLVYSLLIAILKHLPGILRFSLRFLNITFCVAFVISLMTVWPEYVASNFVLGNDWTGRFANLTFVLERATSFAELLVIISILAFVLFFPVRVPRNLAAISTGLCLTLFVRIGSLLIRTYLPALSSHFVGDSVEFVMAGCMAYWIFSLDKAGEEARVTLGRGWQTVPHDHLVRQLEAMNAALLRSREQS